jgi:hypothetical protein
MQSVISNRQASATYNSDIPYTFAFKQLESIGKDIIDQTDPCIAATDSSKMSTCMLRADLYLLEQHLANLSVNHPNIFDAYVAMMRTINSVQRNKMSVVINLMAALTYQKWEDLPPIQQKFYEDTLGSEFIDNVNSNELITILLQSQEPELILTGAYLYPLLKMLFICFGYSRLVPNVTDGPGSKLSPYAKGNQRKHLEKYRGAFFRRGDNNSDILTATESSPFSDSETNHDTNPVDQCIYDFIRLFGDFCPTIIGLMGGTEQFPPESIEISCDDIPSNYDNLSTIPEYLWRFNDYSYCRYLEFAGSKQITNAISSKISSKAKKLHSI